MVRSVFAAVAALTCATVAIGADPSSIQETKPTSPSSTSSVATATSRPRRIPTSEFAAPPLILQPLLSPDGKRLLSRMQVEGKEVLGIFALADAKLQILPLGEKQDLRWYRWAGNNHILISIAMTVPWFGDEAEMTRLVSYDLSTKAAMLVGKKSEGLEGDDLLYVDPDGGWVLLSLQRTIYDYPSVFKIDLVTNAMKEVVKQRPDVWEWYADGDGVVRAGIGFSDRYWSMVYRKSAEEKFRKLGRAKYDDEDAALDILRFARGSDEGFVLSNRDTGRYALHRFNYATKQLGELVFKSDTNDITDFSTTADGTKLRAVWYTDERDRVIWFDDKMKSYQSDIDGALKQNENWIGSRSKDDGAMLVWTGASNDPGHFYYYVPAAGAMKRIASLNGVLKRNDLAPTRYVSYKARDGLQVPAYLTLPQGRPAKNLPLVILPHGGPFGVRDTPDFNAEVQFLVNRGYSVLQPNFRGSSSYGKQFYEQGEGQWGRKMQDDLDDGMDWLVTTGVVDPKRVCIVGSSYGGYASLWGATRNPERYRCAASFAGISDLGKQLKYQLNFRIDRRYSKDWRRKVQGGEDFDTRTVSPLFSIDQLRIPVLLAHGDADQTVPYKQSKLYADALQRAGKSYEFYTYKDEGHDFSKPGNFQNWLDRLDAFLTKHNPAD